MKILNILFIMTLMGYLALQSYWYFGIVRKSNKHGIADLLYYVFVTVIYLVVLVLAVGIIYIGEILSLPVIINVFILLWFTGFMYWTTVDRFKTHK